ncbi:MAG: hypothetical protein ABIH23_25140 [bacterium]
MGIDAVPPIHPATILLTGEAQQIYHAIQHEADVTLNLLRDSVTHKEVNPEKVRNYTNRVKERLNQVSTLKTSLHGVDRKLDRWKKTDPLLKRYSEILKANAIEDSLDNLVEFLVKAEKRPIAPDQFKALPMIQTNVSQSLNCRIEISWIWNEILGIRRLVLVGHVMILADRLTDIAIALKDNQALERVRSILQQLDFTAPPTQPRPALDLPLDELKKMLLDGIAELEKTCESIQRLNEDRREIKETTSQLKDTLERHESGHDPGKTETSSAPDSVRKNKQGGSGMHVLIDRNRLK